MDKKYQAEILLSECRGAEGAFNALTMMATKLKSCSLALPPEDTDDEWNAAMDAFIEGIDSANVHFCAIKHRVVKILDQEDPRLSRPYNFDSDDSEELDITLIR